MKTLMIGWTTTSSLEEAQKIAQSLVENNFAACVQIDGPISSFYRWQGQVEFSKEYRMMIKFLSHNEREIESSIKQLSSYKTPQWFAVEATVVSKEYLNWANDKL